SASRIFPLRGTSSRPASVRSGTGTPATARRQARRGCVRRSRSTSRSAASARIPSTSLVTPGAKPNLFYGFLATLSPGDEALVPDPGFPIYASMVRFCGATPVPVPPRLDPGRALDLDVLERAITPRTRLVVFNSPSNPAGAVVPEADLRRLAALAD